MTFGATTTDNINDWLSGFATGRKAALERGAQRFAALVSPFSELEAAHPIEGDPRVPVILNIESGLHRGASMALEGGEYLLGSGDDCDIVLRDGLVEPHHCRLTREWFGFSLCDVRGGKPQPIAPQAVNYRGGEIEAVYDAGGILLNLRQPVPAGPEAAPEPSVERRWSWIWPTAVLAGLAVTAGVFVAADRVVAQVQVPMPQRIVRGNQALAAAGLSSIHFRQSPHGGLEVVGLVTDASQWQRLHEWLQHSRFEDAHIAVQLLPDLLEQARHALATENLQVSLHADRLRIEGTTPQLVVKDRIRTLAADLRGTVAVEDQVKYVEASERAAPAPPFPIKLRAVMVGKPSYFLSDRGVRYFVGGVLPDGAEVLAIDAQHIRFQLNGKVLVYNLE
jgi:Inner membrane component of T3SS, cytoplasmic domain